MMTDSAAAIAAPMPEEPRRRRRLKPTSELLRRAARRADIARKLRQRDIYSTLIGLGLGLAGLTMPHAIERHRLRKHHMMAPTPAPADLAATPAVPTMVDPTTETVNAPGDHMLARARDGMFYATVLVNGQPVRFLVDTGASVVTLTTNDARRLGVMPPPNRFAGRAATASGRAVFGWTALDRVELAGQRIEDVRAAVVAGDASISLLGQNFLARLGTVRLEKDRLVIG